MANVIKDALTWLRGQRQSYIAVTVTYRRGTTTASVIVERVGKMLRVTDEFGGSRLVYVDRAYLIGTDQLTTFGDPENDDEIVDEDGTYRAAPYNGERCFQPSPHGEKVVIRTKKVRDA